MQSRPGSGSSAFTAATIFMTMRSARGHRCLNCSPSQTRLKAARIASMSAASASDFENGMGAYVKELASHILSDGFAHQPTKFYLPHLAFS
jgi:hypothetical protein